MAAAASSSFSSSKFSPDSPPRISLTPDQFKQCSEALSFFREKLHIPHTITQEFTHLQANRITPSEMRRSCTVALDSVNSSKNRYSDVIPFDKNRVVLNSCKDYRPAARGFINASLITTSSSENISQFIATQGPLPQTYEDFWEMVMQYRCPVVVMLTTLVDNYQIVKCGDYFQAEDGPREFGNTHIVTKWIKTTDTSIVLRHLEVKYKEAYSAIHYQWSWNPLSSKMYHMMHGPKSNEKEECKSDPKVNNKYKEIMSTNIPRRKSRRNWLDDTYQQYEGFWCDPYALEGLLWAQDHFKPQPNHLILSSAPKSGTTWLKAISFAIVTRSRFRIQRMYVSLWHFVRKMSPKAAEELATEDLRLEDAFQLFCEGISLFGPYWDHVLGFWRASLESPERVLFLKYEDLKNETEHGVKKIAQFMGYPFSVEEEDKGMVQKIINLCSFENLSSLEVNKSGITHVGANLMVFKNSTFFRKGKVGDWKNSWLDISCLI